MEDLIHIAGRIPAIFEKSPNTERGPGLILIEEIWGLTPHIADVAKRFAREGFEVLAPELLADTGILEKVEPKMFAQMRSEDEGLRLAAQARMRDAIAPIRTPEFAQHTIEKLAECYAELAKVSNGSIAVVGFCFGGTYAFHLAANEPTLKAAVPFYGQPPSKDEIARIECPVLAFYGDQDTALMETLPQLQRDMAQAGKDFEAVVYEGAGHAFFNDTSIAYHKEFAADAWEKALAFLRAHVS